MMDLSHAQKIKHHFNQAAKTYDAASFPQQFIGQTLINMLLPYAHQAPLILDLGCGTGTTTQSLIDTLKPLQLMGIDLSDEAILIAKKKLSSALATFKCADFLNFKHDHSFNLIFSNMALHWATDFSELMFVINKAISQQGYLAFSVPMPGHFIELPDASKNSYFNKTNMEKEILSNEFELLHYQNKVYQFHFSHPRKAFKSLKKTGVTYLYSKQASCLTKTLYKSIQSLTYNIGYFIARKK